MSVFTVKLVPGNVGAGTVSDPAVSAGVSIQKSMWAPGPNNTHRKLNDGETFTDSNYWKRYASLAEGGTLPADIAFITIVTDDGSVYDDHNPNNNTFARVHDLTVTAGTTFTLEANIIDVLSLYGGFAVFTQITTDQDVKVRLNGSASADLDVATGTQVFDNGDLSISSLAFDNSASGATDATVQVMFSILTQNNS